MEQALHALLEDPLLLDVPRDASLRQLQALCAIDAGDVLTFRLTRFDQQAPPLTVAVAAASRVSELKRELQRVVAAAEEPALGGRRLSWKHVWKNWTLVCDGRELSEPRAALSALGVASGSELSFRARERVQRVRRSAAASSARRRPQQHKTRR